MPSGGFVGVMGIPGGTAASFAGRLTWGVLLRIVVAVSAEGAGGQPVGAGSTCNRAKAAASCSDHGQPCQRRSRVRRAWRAILPDW